MTRRLIMLSSRAIAVTFAFTAAFFLLLMAAPKSPHLFTSTLHDSVQPAEMTTKAEKFTPE